MRMKLLLFSVSLTMLHLLGCTNKDQEKKSYKMEKSPVIDIELNNVSFIRVNERDRQYEIRDSEGIKRTLTILKQSHLKYIKFGSKSTFKIYDTYQNILIEAFFNDDLFKINGVVYQSNQNLFE